MMDELKDVKRVLNPTEVLLVVDAMTGQEAAGIQIIFLFCFILIFLIFKLFIYILNAKVDEFRVITSVLSELYLISR